MKMLLCLFAIGVVTVSIQASRAGDCNCRRPAPVIAVAPVVHQPVLHVAPVVGDACGCSAAVPACCGLGGLAGVGSIYSSHVAYGGFAAGGHSTVYHGSPAPGSFESGFENLPNMDGGGIHHRYPYHSYRRPWAFPGTPSTNVTIVW